MFAKLLHLISVSRKGAGLGKDGAGIVAPIGVAIKNNRTGLGLESELERVAAAKKQFVAQAEQARVASFKDRMAQKFQERVQRVQLHQCEATAHRLDVARGKPDGPYAPKPKATAEGGVSKAQAVEEEEEDTEPVWPRLEAVLLYLRREHRYCFYCGHTFASEEELATKCPGPFEAEHE